MRFLIVAIIATVALSACAQLARLIDSTGETVGKGVTEYCKAPQETRDQIIASANKQAAPNTVTINCAP